MNKYFGVKLTFSVFCFSYEWLKIEYVTEFKAENVCQLKYTQLGITISQMSGKCGVTE